MAPGTKRIALGGLALAIVAWFAIAEFLPEPTPLAPEPRNGEGLRPIPEREPRPAKAKTPPTGCAPTPTTVAAAAAPSSVPPAAPPASKDCP